MLYQYSKKDIKEAVKTAMKKEFLEEMQSSVKKIEYSINGLSSRSQGDKDKETIQGLKKTLEDNMEKFNVMVLCLQNSISKNDELKIRLANRN